MWVWWGDLQNDITSLYYVIVAYCNLFSCNVVVVVPWSDGGECSLLIFTGPIDSHCYHRKCLAALLVGYTSGGKKYKQRSSNPGWILVSFLSSVIKISFGI